MKSLARAGLLVLALCGTQATTLPARAADWAVIVMYHRFGESEFPSTSIRLDQFEAHLAELEKPQYTVMPIPEIVDRLRRGESLPDRTVGISVDDAYRSVYTEAWPRLRKAGFPFTVFVSTDAVDRGGDTIMTWDQLRDLSRNGVTIANHTASHLHMAETDAARDLADIEKASGRLEAELGKVPKIFAYPYGEYSLAVRDVVRKAGFTAAFGQHSGVAYAGGDMFYLPRFAMNQHFGDIGRFTLAVNALPLRVKDVSPEDPLLSAANNPPNFGFTVTGEAAARVSRLNCYPSQGNAVIERLGPRVEVRLDSAFPTGRARINCTMLAPSGRWRWFGMQFLVPR